jgi:hypothetical protein
VIFIDTTDSNKIKARNGITGKIDYSGTNAGTIINDAISALTNGGKIFIKAGTYTLTAKLAPTTSNIELCGEGFASILKLGNSVNDRNLQLLGVTNWHIHNLAFDGNRANQSSTATNCFIIQIGNASSNCTVDHCYIHDAMTMGLHAFSSTNIYFLDNYVQNCNANGIQIENDGGGQNSVVSGNIVNGISDVGISCFGSIECVVSHNEIKNCALGLSPYGVNSSYAIDIEAATGRAISIINNICDSGSITVDGACSDVIISKNQIYNVTKNSADNSGIAIAANVTNCTVEGNVIDTIASGGIFANTGSGISIINNTITNINSNSTVIYITGVNNITLRGNTIIGFGSAGSPALSLSSSNGLACTDNFILASSNAEFNCDAISCTSSDALIANNTIDFNNTTGSVTGIAVNTNNNTVEGNIFKNPGTNVTYIQIASGSTQTIITNNQFTGTPGTTITDGGTKTHIYGNIGFNPLNKITNMLNTTNNTIGTNGSTTTPVASTDYLVQGPDLLVTVSGGTGVSITIKDGAGNTVQSGLSTITALYLPYGYKINFGSFSSTPSILAFGL